MAPSAPHTGRRRPRGEGTVFQRCEKKAGCPDRVPEVQADGTTKLVRPEHKCRGQWIARLRMDDGQVLQASGRTENLAKSRIEDKRRQYEKFGTTGKAITVEAWCTEYLDRVAKLRPNTRAQYQSIAKNYVIRAIGDRQVRKVQPAEARKILTGDKLSKLTSTRRQAYIFLNGLFEAAKREGYAPRNIMDVVSKPNPKKTEREGPTTAEARKLLSYNAGSGDRLASRWAAVFYTLQRSGECLGLERDRVLWDEDLIDLGWQLDDLPYKHGCAETPDADDTWPCGKKRAGSCPDRDFDLTDPDYEYRQVYRAWCLVRPKSRKGERLIPMIKPMRLMLEQRFEQIDKEKNDYIKDHGLVWCKPNGRPIPDGEDGKAWRALLGAAGLPHYDLHGGRHTGATLLLEAGVPDRIVQMLMGHAKATTTHGYQHPDLTLLRRHMVDALEKPLAITA